MAEKSGNEIRNKRIGVIGGNGRFGSFIAKFLSERGCRVLVSDIGTELTNKEVVEQSDCVIFSVPISSTVEVIENVIPYTRREQILIDLTSLKVPAVNAMLKSECEVLGLHPMFSHHVENMAGQTMIMCKARERGMTFQVEQLFIDEGLSISYATPDQHDRMMAVIQGLTHFQMIAFGECLRNMGISPEECMKYASPIYRIRMDMVGRVLAQDSRLYAEIETYNPYMGKAVGELLNASERLGRIIDQQDMAAFRQYFETASVYLGEFRDRALNESNFLIKALSDKVDAVRDISKNGGNDRIGATTRARFD